jgi:hypothetical protein
MLTRGEWLRLALYVSAMVALVLVLGAALADGASAERGHHVDRNPLNEPLERRPLTAWLVDAARDAERGSDGHDGADRRRRHEGGSSGSTRGAGVHGGEAATGDPHGWDRAAELNGCKPRGATVHRWLHRSRPYWHWHYADGSHGRARLGVNLDHLTGQLEVC